MRTWTIDPTHSTVRFAVRHLMLSKVRGRFGAFTGELREEEGDRFIGATSKIDTASIDTRDERRDAHLRSAEFFDAEKSPQITFESTKVEPRGRDTFVVRGNLAIRSVTREAVGALSTPLSSLPLGAPVLAGLSCGR